MKIFKKRLTIYYLLFTILLFGGFLRFYNLDWDEGHFFHPDERNIDMAVSRIHFFDQLDPKFFAYGSLPVYLYRAAGDILVAFTHNPAWVSDWAHINLIGRGFSAFFSTLTIFLVFLIVKKIWREKTAILASFFTAFTVSLIQTAHYGVTESLLTFWLILLVFISLDLTKRADLYVYLKIGLILGLGAATKISALSFLILPSVAHLAHHFKDLRQHLKFLFALMVGLTTFVIFSPYTFLNSEKFLESMRYENAVAVGKSKVVYVLQFEKTLPYFFQIKNFLWQMGPVAFLGLLGAVFLIFTAFKKRDKNLFVLLAFPLVYFLYVGSWYTKFIRYMVPILPFLAIFAAWLLVEIEKKWQKTGIAIIGLLLLLASLWTLAFFSIYTRPQTRILASQWIYQNIPPTAKILTEHWDDGLPVALPPNYPNQYRIEQLTIYEPDNQGKINYYATKLSESDYLMINSRRLYGTLIHLPEKYPITSRYYQLLFSGQLGYTRVAEFSSYPEIFGFEINDDPSEETFQVYDHPKALIFKNTDRLTKDRYLEILEYE